MDLQLTKKKNGILNYVREKHEAESRRGEKQTSVCFYMFVFALSVRSRTRASEEESGYVSVLLFAFWSLFTLCVRREAVVHYHERSCSCSGLRTCADYNHIP